MQTVTSYRRWARLFAVLVLQLASCSDSEDCSATASCAAETKVEDGASKQDGSVVTSVAAGEDAGSGAGAAPLTPNTDAGPEKGPVVIFIEECGDALRTGEEACDDGFEFNQGAYGGCNPNCTKAPFCGDGEVTDDETCDTEAAEGEACDESCGVSPVCGDGKRTGAEECDRGEEGNTGAYGGCTAECKLSAHCGDGDRNVANEQCDLGEGMNTGAYGGCQADCTKAPYCGDGAESHGEECDQGTAGNDGSFGGCKADCTLAPLCDEPGGQTQCGTSCADLLTDEENCGKCGEKCPNNYACEMGECKVLCLGGTRCTNDLCVDTTSDINYCGGCDVPACQGPPANGDPICSKSTCGIDCFDNFTQCGNACFDLNNDVNKCGTTCNDALACKGPAQHGSVDCTNGKCEIDCDAGFTECDGNCYDLDSDVLHCGKCAPCAEKPNTHVACGGGACKYTCDDNPLSCRTDAEPACGLWDFESGTTEGWTHEPAQPRDAVASISVATDAYSNGTSLAVEIETSAATGTSYANLTVTPCPDGSAAEEKSLAFSIRIVPAPGFPVLSGVSQIEGALWWLDADGDHYASSQTQMSITGSDWIRVPDSVWPGYDAPTTYRIGLEFKVPNWRGTVYVDEVTLE